MTDTKQQAHAPEANTAETSAIGDDDFYMDGPYLVFTEAYHLQRGYCCQSGCRHCPYGFGENADSATTDSVPSASALQRDR